MSTLLPKLFRRYFNDGSAEIVNFSERTLSWIISSAHSHMLSNTAYPFKTQDVKLLNPTLHNDMRVLIPCSKQVTSQWFIHKMMTNQSHIHAFSELHSNFDNIKRTFKLSKDSFVDDDILHDDEKRIRIEKADIDKLSSTWMDRHGYNEYFDVILDELALDKMITVDMDNYVQTTFAGHALKPTGIIYVMHKKLIDDISGAKLRQKIGNLYPNTHFELISERNTPWTTQFVFLKVDSCANVHSNGRSANRVDHAKDIHDAHNQNSIYGESEVLKNAGMDMKSGMDRVFDAFGVTPDKPSKGW